MRFIILFLVALGVIAFAYFAFFLIEIDFFAIDFFAIDSCLDRGGCWNQEGRQCVTEQTQEYLCKKPK
jgi:hypothetical protein